MEEKYSQLQITIYKQLREHKSMICVIPHKINRNKALKQSRRAPCSEPIGLAPYPNDRMNYLFGDLHPLLLHVAEENHITTFSFGLKKHLLFKENTSWDKYEGLSPSTSVTDLCN